MGLSNVPVYKIDKIEPKFYSVVRDILQNGRDELISRIRVISKNFFIEALMGLFLWLACVKIWGWVESQPCYTETTLQCSIFLPFMVHIPMNYLKLVGAVAQTCSLKFNKTMTVCF